MLILILCINVRSILITVVPCAHYCLILLSSKHRLISNNFTVVNIFSYLHNCATNGKFTLALVSPVARQT